VRLALLVSTSAIKSAAQPLAAGSEEILLASSVRECDVSFWDSFCQWYSIVGGRAASAAPLLGASG
jgi:hypothetical protein